MRKLLIGPAALAIASSAGAQEGAWDGDTQPAEGILRLGFGVEGEGHYVLFMTCRVGSGWVSMTQNEAHRPDGAMEIQVGSVILGPVTRHSLDGLMGPWTETMLPASHPVFVGMSRGEALTVNGVTYPVRSFAEQRKVAAYSLACDSADD